MMFDFSNYSPLEVRKAEEALTDWINSNLLSIKYEDLPTVATRNQQVTEITEAFFDHFDQYPSSSVLYLLGNYILLSYIKNKYSGKNKEENSFHTERREKKDKIREKPRLGIYLDLQNVQNVFNIAQPVRRCNQLE